MNIITDYMLVMNTNTDVITHTIDINPLMAEKTLHFMVKAIFWNLENISYDIHVYVGANCSIMSTISILSFSYSEVKNLIPVNSNIKTLLYSSEPRPLTD